MTHVIASVQRVTRDEWGWAKGFGWALALTFEPRDLWVGLYWCSHPGRFDVYVCLLPLLPIHLSLWGLR